MKHDIARFMIIRFPKLVHLSYMHMDPVREKVIWKFHRQSTQCSAVEMEALQLRLFDVVDKKQG